MQAEYCHLEFNFFEHLPESELRVMKEREMHGLSLCFRVFDKKDEFYVFIDLDNESVHVRHIGGNFIWKWQYIDYLCTIVAHRTNLKKISVIADKNFMRFAVDRLGFINTDGDMYEKRI